jgi:hypothetical protein
VPGQFGEEVLDHVQLPGAGDLAVHEVADCDVEDPEAER